MKYVPNILIGIVCLLLLFGASMKLMGATLSFTKFHMEGLRVFCGVLEIAITALFAYPKTRNIGFFLVCSYLGGATALHLTIGNSPLALVPLTVAWIAMYIERPGIFLGKH